MAEQSDAELACLKRLSEMDDALARMQGALPDDIRPLGDRARGEVRIWKKRLSDGGADLEALSVAMRELSSWMEALAARLLLAPWHQGPKRSLPN